MEKPRQLGQAPTLTIPRDTAENPVRMLGGVPPPTKEATPKKEKK